MRCTTHYSTSSLEIKERRENRVGERLMEWSAPHSTSSKVEWIVSHPSSSTVGWSALHSTLEDVGKGALLSALQNIG